MLPRAPPCRAQYERRQPEQTILYRVIRENAATFLAEMDEAGVRLPPNVRREFNGYLDCGILARGFIRGECESCRRARLIAFSCKRRTICPSCGAKRMAIEAMHLLDHVFPRVPVRQWVLSLPFQLRFLLATDRSILSAILRIFIDVVFARYRSRTHRDDAHCGAVAFIQRFDSALNVNVHFHVLLLDGTYVPSDDDPIFSSVRAPAEQELVALTTTVARRVMRLLVRRGIIDKDGSPQIEIEGVDPGRSRFGWLSSERRAVFADPDPSLGRAGSSAEVLGFSIHAGVAVNAYDRAGLERLVRYVARPPIASGQLQETTDGRIALKFSKARPNGATHVFFSPIQLIRRLTSLIPPSGQNLIRYFGILAPAARLRAKVAPCPKIEVTIPPDPGAPREPSRRSNIDWASLLKRVFDIDALLCPCGGRIRIRAVIEDRAVIRRILTHLRLDAELPRFAPARAPP